jgi:DNA mismatch repair protein MutS
VFFDNALNKLVYDRKLKDGPGDCMYGLEVCKSLDMPQDFLQNAYDIRTKYFGHVVKSSHFNAKKIMSLCEKCQKRVGTEVHHTIPQKMADKRGIIQTDDLLFHKNHLANLVTLCEQCHHEIHTK